MPYSISPHAHLPSSCGFSFLSSFLPPQYFYNNQFSFIVIFHAN